jgi:hypothetical protein
MEQGALVIYLILHAAITLLAQRVLNKTYTKNPIVNLQVVVVTTIIVTSLLTEIAWTANMLGNKPSELRDHWRNFLVSHEAMKAYNGNIFGHFIKNICCVCDLLQEIPKIDCRETYPATFLRNVMCRQIFDNYKYPEVKLEYDPCSCDPEKQRRGITYFYRTKIVRQHNFASTIGNEVLALTMRYLRKTPDQIKETWNMMENHLNDIGNQMTRKLVNFKKIKLQFRKWLSRYDLKQQLRLINNNLEPLCDDNNFGMFTKFESGAKDPNKLLKPRGVFPKSDIELWKTGPWCYAVKQLYKIFDGIQTPFLFGAGNSPKQLGYKVTRLFKLPYYDYRYYSADLAMCETTMCGNLINLEAYWMKKFGMPNDIIKLLYCREYASGHTNNGAHLKMRNCRLSGTSNTTIGNTINYLMCIWMSCRANGINDDEFKCIISGDDCAIFFLDRIPHELVVKIFEDINKLGLQPELKQHNNFFEMSFFSGTFIPVKRPNGSYTLTHTPLIGRFVVKNLSVKDHESIPLEQIAYDTAFSRNKSELIGNPILLNINKHVMETLKLDYGGTEEKSYKWIDQVDRDLKNNLIADENTISAIAEHYDIDIAEIHRLCNIDAPRFGSNIDSLFGEMIIHDLL